MNPDISIRKATRDDLAKILDLVIELAVFEKEPDAVTATLEDYQEAWDNELIDCIVATTEVVVADGQTPDARLQQHSDHKVIGVALYYDTFSTWKGKMMYMEDFVVSGEYRSKGVGKMIYDEVFREAERRKAILVKWQVLDWNEGAIKFYEREGATIEKEWWNGKKYL